MLRDLVVRTVEELSRDSKVCIFIDGLDEFGGDPQTIISFVDTVLQMPNVKLCVSSRPWAQFQSAFGRASTLRMQDLTYPDIRHFVQTRFDECPGFRRLVEREPGYAANLIHQVVERSSGVFLWVRLVADSLITGLSNDLLPRDLDTLLRSLPPELDDLYARILDDIDPSSFERACRHFQLLLANDGWAEAMLLSFADEDRGFFREVPFALMSLDEYTARLDALERRLGACCKGLLEVSADRRVNFLHRTVRDFLDSPATRERVGAATKHSGFDAHLQLCSGFYCLIRATAFGAWSREPFSFAALDGPLLLNPDSRAVEAGLVGAAAQVRTSKDTAVPQWITQCLHHAALAAPTSNHPTLAILDSLSNKLALVPELRDHLTAECFMPSCTPRARFRLSFHGGEPPSYIDLLPLATRHGVAAYVRAKVAPGALCWAHRADYRGPLLALREKVRGMIALGTLAARAPPAPQTRGVVAMPLLLSACFCAPPDPEVFGILLDSGADVGFRLGHHGRPRIWAGERLYVDLRRGTMLEMIVAVALGTSVAADGADEAARAWGLWGPVFAVLTSRRHRLDVGLAKSVVGRCRILTPRVSRDPSTCLKAEDLVGVLCADGEQADRNDARVWKVIMQKAFRPKV